jgi:hypothetical protein
MEWMARLCEKNLIELESQSVANPRSSLHRFHTLRIERVTDHSCRRTVAPPSCSPLGTVAKVRVTG